MISSAVRLNVWVELVAKASMTDSSRPELASLITSATGPVALTLAGNGFSSETRVAGASVSTGGGVSSAGSSATAATSGSYAGGAVGWAATSRRAPANARMVKLAPKL